MEKKNLEKEKLGGFTLAEVLVSGALLVMLAFMMAQGFAVCTRLVLKSRQCREADGLLEEQIVRKTAPFTAERIELEVGDYGAWEVVIENYEGSGEQEKTSFQVMRKGGYEK